MGNSALGALSFILGTVLNLYAMVVALRFVMQVFRADYYNPLAQFVVKVTDPLLVPMRRFIPSIKRYDTSSAVLCFGVILLKFIVIKVLHLGYVHAIGRSIPVELLTAPAIVGLSIVDLVHLFFNIFIFAIFIQAILSWLPQAGANPMQNLLGAITEPVLRPIRRFVPPLGGMDLSSLVAIIGLYALQLFVVGTLLTLVIR